MKNLEVSIPGKNRVILTGGPGGGKSSLLEELRKTNFLCVDEVARKIIKKEVAKGGNRLPWEDSKKFRDYMFEEQVKVCESIKHKGLVFFDRGPIDCIAYSNLIGVDISEEMDRIARQIKFNNLVFVTPPWEEIYQNDKERKQTFQEAIETYEKIVMAYRDYGYEPLDLPKVSVGKRIEFILKKLNLDEKQDILIRAYRPDDAVALANIYYNTIHTINAKDYTQEQLDVWAPASTLNDLSGWQKKWEQIPPLVAIVRETVVGFTEFEESGHIDCFYCHHDWIGKGVGRSLMRAIESKADEKGIKRIYAEVSITAKTFFERAGFQKVKQQVVVRKNVELTNFVMEKFL